MTGNIIYPDEEIILQLRKDFKLSSTGYLSKGSFLYILDTVQDLYNEEDFLEALAAKAAYILFNIVNSHPFIDGNKRTAYGTTDIFLRLNGYRISVNPKAGVEFIVGVAEGRSDEAKVRMWTKQHLKKLS
ncbi:MAG: type II toxin-antitoxin system death-on-curing family toxin [Thaumarchaeota archaeon]|nr:type II toxin-antitoxin system death-on-curing family toxin [Nitrososphaerota archaeon]